MKVCFYEDKSYSQFQPLTSMRPVYLLRAGILPLFQRVFRKLDCADLLLSCRNQIAGIVSAEVRDIPVNIIKHQNEDLLLLNGRIRDYGDLGLNVSAARLSTKYVHDDETVAVLMKADLLQTLPSIVTQVEIQSLFDEKREKIGVTETNATLYSRCWELVDDIGKEIASDYEVLEGAVPKSRSAICDGAYIINSDNIFLGDSVKVMPSTVIDATEGPVYIGAFTRVEPQAAIFGPAYIGPNSVIAAGKIAGSSIGHTCRVGGEVEESIFHAYVNKHHDGFIGHSYVGPWVNFGAMTTNSDLKNNYSNVRVVFDGESIDTGSIKVGSFIGDHSKFGIGTLLNTGIRVGVCCNLFGGSLISDKEVPSFSWGQTGNWASYDFEKALQTARRTCERRNVELSLFESEQLKTVCEGRSEDDGILSF